MGNNDDHKTTPENDWFTRHVLRHQPSLKRYLRRLSKSDADAEDIEQEAFLKVYEANKTNDIKNPRAFLFRTAYNLFVQGYRKSKNAPYSEVADIDALSVKDMCAAADERLIMRERLGALAEAVDRLPPKTRSIFIMRKVYNLSQKEIREALGVPERTIERHVRKGLQACRDYLRERDHYWDTDQGASDSALASDAKLSAGTPKDEL